MVYTKLFTNYYNIIVCDCFTDWNYCILCATLLRENKMYIRHVISDILQVTFYLFIKMFSVLAGYNVVEITDDQDGSSRCTFEFRQNNKWGRITAVLTLFKFVKGTDCMKDVHFP